MGLTRKKLTWDRGTMPLGHGLGHILPIVQNASAASIRVRLVGGTRNPDFTNAPGHGDDDARFYDRQQAYVHARGG